MNDPALAIIPCPQCGVKNRIGNYDSDKTPGCARCRANLMDKKEHEAFQKFQENLNQFKDLPDVGFRPKASE